MHKLHTNKISLLLCLPPQSADPKETLRGMIHGLLSKHWRYCCRIEDYTAKVQQLCRGLMNRGHCPVILKQLFTEVSNILKKEKEIIGSAPLEDVQLELKVEQESKDMKIFFITSRISPKGCFEIRITTNL